MGKPDQGSAAAEGARRATGDAAGPGRGGRLSVGRTREVVWCEKAAEARSVLVESPK